MKYILFNENLVLKPDEGRTLILASLVGRNLLIGQDDSFTDIIHPIYAMILCFVDGREINECVNEAASYLSVPKELVLNFINSLVDNPKQVILSGKKGNSVFPPYTIVSMQSPSQIKRYSPNLFKYDQIDLRMKRHLTPSTITLMFNNICVTNCIYCYQDKSHVAKCTIPLERIKELIREAYKLNVNTFDVIGGEFFLYKYWRDVLAELRRYGYNPYLSTKMPLQENDVQFLAKLKVRDIQISLDSCIEEHLIESINVRKGYVAEMLKSLMLLEKYGILVKVHSVLTKYTKDIADMRSIYNVLKNLKNIEDWHVVKGEETLYPRTDYSNIEIDSLSYNNIVNYLKDLSDSSGMSIHYPKLEQIQIVNNTIDKLKQAESHFFNRAFCSGLFSSLYILPDGQVTMCEQLYWNKRFIIGNVKSNSILEIWNSKEAKSLYEIKQEDFPEDSLFINKEIQAIKNKTLLKPGNPFDLDVIIKKPLPALPDLPFDLRIELRHIRLRVADSIGFQKLFVPLFIRLVCRNIGIVEDHSPFCEIHSGNQGFFDLQFQDHSSFFRKHRCILPEGYPYRKFHIRRFIPVVRSVLDQPFISIQNQLRMFFEILYDILSLYRISSGLLKNFPDIFMLL